MLVAMHSSMARQEDRQYSAVYQSQAARDAQRMNYGRPSYWAYLDRNARENAAMWRARGETDRADDAMFDSLGQRLANNTGD